MYFGVVCMKKIFWVFLVVLILTASLCFDAAETVAFADEIVSLEEESASVEEKNTNGTEEGSTAQTAQEPAEEQTKESSEGTDGIMVLLGDVNGNEKLDADDAREILRACVGLILIEAENLPVADIDSDGVITASDARLALRTAVSLEEIISHKYLITVENEATCKAEGIVSYYCTDCSVTGQVHISEKPHTYVTLINISPTCTKNGYINKVCTGCSRLSVSTPEKLGHNWKKNSAKVATTCSRCSLQKTGWEKYKGKYYYFYEQNGKSVLAVNQIVDGVYVDIDGVRVDDEVIKLAVEFVQTHSSAEDTNEKRLEDCYNYLYKRFDYKTMYGVPTVNDMSECARHMFINHNGNCYRFASTFAYIARVLGYDSRVVLGKVRGVYGDMVNHSYTEVFSDGEWLICDASQNTAYEEYDWYLCKQENYPKKYSRELTLTLSVKNGKAVWN